MKNPIFRGAGFTKIQYRGGDCLKWGLGQFAGLRGLGKKAGSVFEGSRRGWWRGGVMHQCTLSPLFLLPSRRYGTFKYKPSRRKRSISFCFRYWYNIHLSSYYFLKISELISCRVNIKTKFWIRWIIPWQIT